MTTKRPWGFFHFLFRGKGVWLKRIQVTGGATSLQRHQHRDELWVIYVPAGVTHRIIGRGSLLELALGTPRESDIRRLEDLYGRRRGQYGSSSSMIAGHSRTHKPQPKTQAGREG